MGTDKIKIGLTIGIKDPTESLFTNGIKQNAIIMRDTLNAIDFVEEVYFINFGKQRDLSKSPWKIYEHVVIDYEQALDTVNAIVCATQFISGNWVKRATDKGIRVINQTLGNEYYGFLESLLFKENHNSIMKKHEGYSALWATPQHVETNKDILEALFDLELSVCPYIWSPQFIQPHVDVMKKKGHSGSYENKGSKKRISMFEPNINIVKTSVFPMIVSEKLFMKRPELIEKVNVFASSNFKDKPHFKKFASSLDVYKAGKMFFEMRYPIVWSLFEHTDIVIAHQQDNALNYLYFDVAWLGYPIVHNAHMIKELGFYYSGFYGDRAVDKLVDVIENFDKSEKTRENYLKYNRKYISNFLPTHPRNVAGYAALLEKLF